MAGKQASLARFFATSAPKPKVGGPPTPSSTPLASVPTPSPKKTPAPKKGLAKRPLPGPAASPGAKRPKPPPEREAEGPLEADGPNGSGSDAEEGSSCRFLNGSTPEGKPCQLGKKSAAQFATAVAAGKDIEFMQGTGQADVFTTGTRVREKLTPLEEQFVSIKKQNPDTLLFVECGYKFRFFGRDAEVAARHLKIMLVQREGEPFTSASVPVQRLYYHVDRLVRLGYKVGVVEQTESAAFREASSSKPFDRQLTKVFTRATFVPEDDAARSATETGDRPADGGFRADHSRLVILSEESAQEDCPLASNPRDVRVTLVAISLLTGGAVIWDVFEDGPLRRELETRLYQLAPVELLIPDALSPASRSVVYGLGVNTWGAPEDESRRPTAAKAGSIRLETRPAAGFAAAAGAPAARQFYTEGGAACPPGLREEAAALPEGVLAAISVALTYLEPFRMKHLLFRCSSPCGSGALRYFERFSCLRTMLLPASTLANLEVFQSTSAVAAGFFGQTAWQGRGSLYWHLNHTRTPFGARLLYRWLCGPLRRPDEILARQEAVAEMAHGPGAEALAALRKAALEGLPDLERVLTKCHHLKASPAEFLKFLKACQRVTAALQGGPAHGTPHRVGDAMEADPTPATKPSPHLPGQLGLLQSELLRETLASIQAGDLDQSCSQSLAAFDHSAALANQRGALFLQSAAFPEVLRINEEIAALHRQLVEHLKDVRKELKAPTVEYKSVSGTDYLIEVPVKDVSRVPSGWIVISRIKACHRFHTPFIVECTKRLAQCKERLLMESEQCWTATLQRFSGDHYVLFSGVIHHLAVLDCLFSLAEVAKLPGYCRPELTATCEVTLKDARHPMVERLLQEKHSPVSSGGGDPTQPAVYVPNDVALSAAGQRCMIITGPNMGGKSSYIRQVALVVLMAQLGSYVPAVEAKVGVFDAIYARMGARDDMTHGHSTFMVELQETSDILHRATSQSLVILDELGRGTSTHDGVAIAHATLEHVIATLQCTCLFVTHYPVLTALARTHQLTTVCHYMAFLEDPAAPGAAPSTDRVTFLYKLRAGVSPSSFGLNVARLAGIKAEVLATAAAKAREMHTALAPVGGLAARDLARLYASLAGCLGEEASHEEGTDRTEARAQLLQLIAELHRKSLA